MSDEIDGRMIVFLLTYRQPVLRIHNMSKAQSISETLRQAASEAGGIRSLARATGIEPATLSRFIRGEATIRLDTADRLAEVLGIEVKQSKRKRKG